jgi:hypothetical protein
MWIPTYPIPKTPQNLHKTLSDEERSRDEKVMFWNTGALAVGQKVGKWAVRVKDECCIFNAFAPNIATSTTCLHWLRVAKSWVLETFLPIINLWLKKRGRKKSCVPFLPPISLVGNTMSRWPWQDFVDNSFSTGNKEEKAAKEHEEGECITRTLPQ